MRAFLRIGCFDRRKIGIRELLFRNYETCRNPDSAENPADRDIAGAWSGRVDNLHVRMPGNRISMKRQMGYISI